MRTYLRAAAGLVALIIALTLAATSEAAKTYSAERFDTRVRVMTGGALEVTETVVFRFEDGTFDHVYREIPARRTDGIDIVSASLDGRPFPIGEGVNRIRVTGRSKVRVQWVFPPLANSSHVFVLTYRARGAVFQTSEADVLSWRPLPTEHQYRIGSSTIEFELPLEASGGAAAPPAPKTEWRRVDGKVTAGGSRGTEDTAAPGLVARVTAQQIRANGWIEATMNLPRGSILTAPPTWQQTQQNIQAVAPRWMTAAGLIALAGLILLFGLRQQYDPPAPDHHTTPSSPALPDSLAPGLVGPLLANGRTALEHAMAVFFSLAARGLVSIEERPPGLFGQRSFDIRRRPTRAPLAGHESTLLAIGLDHAKDDEAVPLTTVRRRIVRGFRRFSAAVRQDLRAAGLLDDDRMRVRRRFVLIANGFLALAAAAVVGVAATLVGTYGGWPMLIPAALAFVGVAGLIFSAAATPLSNEGLRRAAGWRGFRKYMKALSQDQQPAAAGVEALLPFAVATGLGAAWGKYLKRHPGGVPPWFRALSAASQDSAFTAFVTSTGAAHGGAAGGGAAGGGSSGAG